MVFCWQANDGVIFKDAPDPLSPPLDLCMSVGWGHLFYLKTQSYLILGSIHYLKKLRDKIKIEKKQNKEVEKIVHIMTIS